MKTKLILLCLLACSLTATPTEQTVTVSVERLLDRAAVNRNIAHLFSFDAEASAFFRGKAEAFEQIANSYQP